MTLTAFGPYFTSAQIIALLTPRLDAATLDLVAEVLDVSPPDLAPGTPVIARGRQGTLIGVSQGMALVEHGSGVYAQMPARELAPVDFDTH